MSISTTDIRSYIGECPDYLKDSFLERALDSSNGFAPDGAIPLDAAAIAIVFKLSSTNQIASRVDEYCIQKEIALRLFIRAAAAIDHKVFDLKTSLAYGLYDAVNEKLRTGEATYDQISHDILIQLVATDKDRICLNAEGVTPLMWTCNNRLPELALALIATGNSHPEHVSDIGYTALRWACVGRISDVALALIATGNCRPEYINANGNTALIDACIRGLSDVALALIATGNCCTGHVSRAGKTALEYARDRDLTDVVAAILAPSPPNTVTDFEKT